MCQTHQKEGYPRAALVAWRLFSLFGQPSSLPSPPKIRLGVAGDKGLCIQELCLSSPVKSRKWMLGTLN